MRRIQVPAVMVTSLTTEKVENVRIVLLTTVKVGDRPYRPRFNPNSEGGERPQRSYVNVLMIAPNVLLTIVKVEIVRIVLASITIMKEVNARNVLTTARWFL